MKDFLTFPISVFDCFGVVFSSSLGVVSDFVSPTVFSSFDSVFTGSSASFSSFTAPFSFASLVSSSTFSFASLVSSLAICSAMIGCVPAASFDSTVLVVSFAHSSCFSSTSASLFSTAISSRGTGCFSPTTG
ncbi:hypothetical protein Hanom_Chr11g01013471 [Helianthus anomalus]